MQAERDELHKRFVKSILEVEQKTNLKNELLYRRIETLNENAELQEALIGKLTADAKVPPQKTNRKLDVSFI